MDTNTDSSKEILECFIKGKFKRMNCPQCENTFLTNVYEMKCFDHGKKLSVKCAHCKQVFLADTTAECMGGLCHSGKISPWAWNISVKPSNTMS